MDHNDIEREICMYGNTNFITDSGLNNGAQVFAIGDSHTIFFYNSMKIKEHWGYESKIPITIYTLLRDGIDIYEVGNLLGNGHEKYNIKLGDYVIFYYGFNDIQRNIYIHAKNTWKQEIKFLINNYIEYVITLAQKYGISPIITALYPNPQQQAIGVNVNGSYDERKMYTQEANTLLEDQCKKHKILYLDVYDIVTDEHGFIKTEYTVDFIHLDYNNSAIRKLIETRIFELIDTSIHSI